MERERSERGTGGRESLTYLPTGRPISPARAEQSLLFSPCRAGIVVMSCRRFRFAPPTVIHVTRFQRFRAISNRSYLPDGSRAPVRWLVYNFVTWERGRFARAKGISSQKACMQIPYLCRRDACAPMSRSYYSGTSLVQPKGSARAPHWIPVKVS